MQEINTRIKKYIAFILIAIISFFCIFSHIDNSCSIHSIDNNVAAYKSASEVCTSSALSNGDIKTPDSRSIVGINIMSCAGSGTQFTRNRQNVKGFEEFLDCAAVCSLPHTAAVLSLIPVLISRSELTPRYVVVVYLHLCDGEKPSLLSHL